MCSTTTMSRWLLLMERAACVGTFLVCAVFAGAGLLRCEPLVAGAELSCVVWRVPSTYSACFSFVADLEPDGAKVASLAGRV